MTKTSFYQGVESEPNGIAPRVIDLDAGRRAFIRSVGLGAAGAAVLGTAAGVSSEARAQSADLDVPILNFALNLEYLEAEFYLHAVFGRGLADTEIKGLGPLGSVNGGRQVNFKDPVVAAYANEIANDEESHVKALRQTLGKEAVSRPPLDIDGAFTTAARAAGLIGTNQTFDAYADDNSFLLAAYIFEDVGVTAYHGAAPFITNKDYLNAAAGILAVEAYHAGLIRTVLFGKGFFKQTALISNLRGTLDGVGIDDQGVGPDQSTKAGGPRTLSNIVPSDANGIAFGRTPRQVLNIVYGAASATSGLFFPQGAHGGPGGKQLLSL